jgi:hypothetical protein
MADYFVSHLKGDITYGKGWYFYNRNKTFNIDGWEWDEDYTDHPYHLWFSKFVDRPTHRQFMGMNINPAWDKCITTVVRQEIVFEWARDVEHFYLNQDTIEWLDQNTRRWEVACHMKDYNAANFSIGFYYRGDVVKFIRWVDARHL